LTSRFNHTSAGASIIIPSVVMFASALYTGEHAGCHMGDIPEQCHKYVADVQKRLEPQGSSLYKISPLFSILSHFNPTIPSHPTSLRSILMLSSHLYLELGIFCQEHFISLD
jgi:hypothetical protein